MSCIISKENNEKMFYNYYFCSKLYQNNLTRNIKMRGKKWENVQNYFFPTVSKKSNGNHGELLAHLWSQKLSNQIKLLSWPIYGGWNGRMFHCELDGKKSTFYGYVDHKSWTYVSHTLCIAHNLEQQIHFWKPYFTVYDIIIIF